MRHTKGTLVPANPYGVTDKIHRQISRAVTANGLNNIIKKSKWESGVIAISTITSSDGLHGVKEFIRALDRLIKSEGVIDLGLYGEIMIILESSAIEPIMVRIEVRNNEVSYQMAKYYVWNESITYTVPE